MQEVYDLRVPERFATQLFGGDYGKTKYFTRCLKIDWNDERWPQIVRRRMELLASHAEDFFVTASISRKYSQDELATAEMFHARLYIGVSPTGEECGTCYDLVRACSHCGYAEQVSDLSLDLRKVPAKREFVSSFAHEWIVSHRVAEILLDLQATGIKLTQVRHKAYFRDDPIDYEAIPAGRKILEIAEELKLNPENWNYYVWLNSEPMRELLELARTENMVRLQRKAIRRNKPLPIWYQLKTTSKRIPTVEPTHYGVDVFDSDPEGAYRCRFGHVSGLNAVSELYMRRSDWDGADFCCTSNMTGWRRGTFRPSPMLLISARIQTALHAAGVKGYAAEIVRFV